MTAGLNPYFNTRSRILKDYNTKKDKNLGWPGVVYAKLELNRNISW
jgi:hypothetical protein